MSISIEFNDCILTSLVVSLPPEATATPEEAGNWVCQEDATTVNGRASEETICSLSVCAEWFNSAV